MAVVMPPSKKVTRNQSRWTRGLRAIVTPLRERMVVGFDLLSIEPVEQAFQELNLDPKNLVDWQILAALFAVHLFGKASGGRRPEWTGARQMELLAHVHDRKQRNAHLSDAEVCRIIARDRGSPDYFRAEGKGEGLRKQLRRARRQCSRNGLARAAFPLAFPKPEK
jgi:hypothetical protein